MQSSKKKISSIALQQFNPRLYVTKNFNQNDILLIKQAFDHHDTNKMGKLTPNDLKVALLHQGFNASKQTAYNIIAEYDQECIGGLNFAAFMRILSSEPRQNESKLELQKVFKKYDKLNKGYITRENFQQVIRAQGQNMSQRQIDIMWYKIDKQNRGKIDFERFCEIMHHPNSIC